MRTALKLSLKFWCVMIVIGANAYATGGYSGAGGDLAISPTDEFAWFYGSSRELRICSVVTPQFGLPSEQVEPLLEKSFQIWRNYILDKKVNEKFSLMRDFFVLNLNYKFLSKCDESEDVTFYFGGTNQQIENSKKQFIEPVGMAILTNFDRQANWGRGFVWIAGQKTLFQNSYPDWQNKDSLMALLLHEIGHIYGNPHIPGTIMTAGIMDIISELSNTGQTSIDISRELYHCDSCSNEMTADQSLSEEDMHLQRSNLLLQRIVGRNPSPFTRVTIKNAGNPKSFELVILEDPPSGEIEHFVIQVTSQRTEYNPFIFSNRWGGWLNSPALTYYGYLMNKAGEKVDLILELNSIDDLLLVPERASMMTISGFVESSYVELANFRKQLFLD